MHRLIEVRIQRQTRELRTMTTLRLVRPTTESISTRPTSRKNNAHYSKSNNLPDSRKTSPTSPHASLLALLERLLELQPEMRDTMHRQLAFMVENAERIVQRNGMPTISVLCVSVVSLL